MNILVVGLGLIGGSILKGLKNSGHHLYGLDLNDETLETCLTESLIVSKHAELNQMDIVFVCLYPDDAVDFIMDNQMSFKSGSIITDVVGLKVAMMDRLKITRSDINFIGGHPMAGREGRGFGVSTAEIFINANYLLVVENVEDKFVQILKEIVYTLGCKHIEVLDAKSHDDIIAYTSHMPHILSTTYMSCDRFDETRHCVAGSFRDITRVSDINADLWSELILENKNPVLHEIKVFKKALEALEAHIINDDNQAVIEFLNDARQKKLLL